MTGAEGGERGAGGLSWRLTVLTCLAAPLVGAAMLLSPTLLALPAAAAFVLLAIEAPVMAVGLFAFAHVATPTYVRMPLPGGLYDPPVSTAILMGLAGVGALAFLAGRRAPALGRRSVVALRLLAAFGAVALVSLIDPRTGGEGVAMWTKVFIIPSVAMAALLCAARTVRDVATVWRWLLAGAVTASLYALYEHNIGYNPLIEAFQAKTDIVYFKGDVLGDLAYRAFSVFGNPIEFGTCVGMIAPFALVRLATAKRPLARAGYAAAFGLCTLGIAVTYSRGPFMAFAIATVLVAAIYPALRRWLAAGAAALAALTLAVWPFIGSGVADRLRDFDNVTLRFKLWETAAALFTDRPILGIGIGNFPEYYIEAARAHRIGPFHEFGEENLEVIRVAENTYLQLAAETGVVGLASAAAAVAAMVGLALHVARRAHDAEARDLAIASLAAMLVYAVNGAFITAYTHFFATLLLIGFAFGAAVALDSRNEARNAGGQRAPSASSTTRTVSSMIRRSSSNVPFST